MEGRMCQHVGLDPNKILSCTRTLHEGWVRALWQLQMTRSELTCNIPTRCTNVSDCTVPQCSPTVLNPKPWRALDEQKNTRTP